MARNWQMMAASAAPAECAAAVKADAYGLGAARLIPALASAGCRTFFVALPEEGRIVRGLAPAATIYVLNGFFTDAADIYRECRLLPVLNTLDEARLWAEQGGARPAALHVDTGMNRLGLTPAEATALAADAGLIAALRLQLVMSHLASAEMPDDPQNQQQLVLFRELTRTFPELPASLANSAGIMLGAEFHFDLVRPGIALYGGSPESSATSVTAEARILQVRDVPAGATIGYGGARRLARRSRVAIVSAGYADGYPRAAGSSDEHEGAAAYFAGARLPLLGRVSMDLVALDATEAPQAESGHWVELFGPDMPIVEVAAAAGTIPYELLTGLSHRAVRHYLTSQES